MYDLNLWWLASRLILNQISENPCTPLNTKQYTWHNNSSSNNVNLMLFCLRKTSTHPPFWRNSQGISETMPPHTRSALKRQRQGRKCFSNLFTNQSSPHFRCLWKIFAYLHENLYARCRLRQINNEQNFEFTSFKAFFFRYLKPSQTLTLCALENLFA